MLEGALHPPTWRERFWEIVFRHKLASGVTLLMVVVSVGVYQQYDKFAYAQTPDPNFDARVMNPAHTSIHPRVLFDAAHFNFHTATGNYRPFADLIRNDGYLIETNRKLLSLETLEWLQRCRRRERTWR
jgi:hypothetical protein